MKLIILIRSSQVALTANVLAVAVSGGIKVKKLN